MARERSFVAPRTPVPDREAPLAVPHYGASLATVAAKKKPLKGRQQRHTTAYAPSVAAFCQQSGAAPTFR
jgi:hypothetical protein